MPPLGILLLQEHPGWFSLHMGQDGDDLVQLSQWSSQGRINDTMSSDFLLTHFHEQLPLLCHGPPPLPTLLNHSRDKNGKKHWLYWNSCYKSSLLWTTGFWLSVGTVWFCLGAGNSRTDRHLLSWSHCARAHTHAQTHTHFRLVNTYQGTANMNSQHLNCFSLKSSELH